VRAFRSIPFILPAALVVLMVACRPGQPAPGTATPCPQATPELLAVDPVTSPTDRLSQTVTVHMGNTEIVTITAESGVFTGAGSPAQVEVVLLADATHHLHVVARVKEITGSDGCVYGGYTLQTRRDRNGAPLVIQQGQPGLPGTPGARIVPENARQLEPLLTLAPEARLTADFAFNGDRELVSVGYADRISRWSLETGQEIGRMGESLEDASALAVDVTADGMLLATGGTAEAPSVRLWSATSQEMRELGRHESYLASVAFNPGGSRLASGSNDDTVQVWDVASGEAVLSFEGDVPERQQSFHSLYWPDGDTLAAAGSDAIYRWDVPTGKLQARIARPENAALFVDVAFSQDATRLAAAAQDDAVYYWEPEASGWAVWPVPEDVSIGNVEFSPDGQLLAATTHAGELLLWSVEAAKLLASYPVTTGSIAAVRFSPDGRSIAVGGWDSPIWLWGIP
jgi:WD40 repeat protein